jgi:YHS domain-containing protein
VSSTTQFVNTLYRLFAACALLTAVLFSFSAFAGDFFEAGGLAIRGYDPVAYFSDNKPAQGSSKFTALYKGSLFRFSSAANRDAFAANAERYAPQYEGFCAYAAAQGSKAAVDPTAFTIVNNKLYLNFNQSTQALWRKNAQGNIAKADRNWPEVRLKPNP